MCCSFLVLWVKALTLHEYFCTFFSRMLAYFDSHTVWGKTHRATEVAWDRPPDCPLQHAWTPLLLVIGQFNVLDRDMKSLPHVSQDRLDIIQICHRERTSHRQHPDHARSRGGKVFC